VTNVALVARKLAVLEEHLRRLRDRRPPNPEAFEADTLLQDAVAMSLLIVVQEAMDIALHMASDEKWGLPATYREAFALLSSHGVISPELAASLGAAAQLRNRIAHGYASLDAERLWSELPRGVAAFAEFAKAVVSFLEGQPRGD
jgi:uncharacterized protein YutE (UPF0331/DUF86 family)